MENVQRYYTRRMFQICNIPYDSYDDRLTQCKIDPLEIRRKVNDLCMTYNIANRYVDIPPAAFFEPCPETSRNLRGHSKKLFSQFARLNVLKYSFSHRVVSPWNGLPERVVNSSSQGSFRFNLLQHFDSYSLT